MAKLKTDPIAPADLVEFLDTSSDFAFEIRVLKLLSSNGYTCEHGGTYTDPATKKPRQFDIRATRDFGNFAIRLAVECKNLRSNFPLLVSCLPRSEEDSFHDITVSVDPDRLSLLPRSEELEVYYRAMEPHAKTVRLRGADSIYKPGEHVGKSADQVGRDSTGAIVANDSDVYGKWAQAISSAEDLTDWACYAGAENDDPACFSYVLPVLVVPDGTLWQTRFDHDGNRTLDPQPADRVSLFVDQSYYAGDVVQGAPYRISHLEIVTITGLKALLTEFDDGLDAVFPRETLVERITNYLASGQEQDGTI